LIKKKYIALIIIVSALALTLDAFALTSVAKYAKYVSIAISAVGFGIFGLYFRKFPKPIRQFGLLFIALLVLSILSANLIHRQSYLSGFIASSSIFIVGTSFLLYYLLVRFSISMELVRKSILSVAWVFLAFFAILFLLHIQFPSSTSSDTVFGFQSLRKGIVNLGAIIYLVQFFKKSHFKYLAFALILFSVNHWADFQRYILFVFAMCIGVLLFNYRKRTVGLKIIAGAIFVVPILVTVLSVTPIGQEFAKKMSATFEIFEEDSDDFSDSSMAIRVTQSLFAFESIKKYPLTGVGRIRSSEKDKVAKTSYFHVSDIGLIGILYSYGIFGLFIFFKQSHYVWKGFSKNGLIKEGPSAEFKLFLLFLIIHSILTGRSLNSPAEFMCMLVFVEVGRKELNAQTEGDDT